MLFSYYQNTGNIYYILDFYFYSYNQFNMFIIARKLSFSSLHKVLRNVRNILYKTYLCRNTKLLLS